MSRFSPSSNTARRRETLHEYCGVPKFARDPAGRLVRFPVTAQDLYIRLTRKRPANG